MMHKAWCSIEEVPYCFPRPSIKFQGHKGQKIDDLDQIWARLLGRSQLSNPSDLPCSRSYVKLQGHMAIKIVDFKVICQISRSHGSIVFSCDQAAIWLVQSVRPSVCLSVTPFSPCSHHRIIMKFSGVITMVKSDVHAKGQGQRSKVKVTEVNTQLSRFRTLTPVWIHIWQWNHAHSWKQHRRGALLFFKVIRQISRSHGSKNRRIWPRLGVSGL